MYTLNKSTLITIFLFFIIMGMVLVLNNYTPMWNDEFAYSFIGGSTKKVTSISDILKSQHYYFNNWTGRNIVHFIIQLFCWLGKEFFNVFNTLIFSLYLICIFIITKSEKNLLNLLFIFAVVWLTAPVLGETVFWLAGSVNYLWTTTYMLFYLLIVNKINNNKIVYLLSFLLGYLHENIFILMGAYFFIETLFNKNITKQQVLKIFFFLLGSFLLILAPGNFVRNKMMYGDLSFENKFNNFFNTMNLFIKNEKIIIISFFVFVLIILIKVKKNNMINKEFWKYIVFFLIGFLSNFIMILSPEFPLRTTFASYSFMLIGSFGLLNIIFLKIKIKKNFNVLSILVIFYSFLILNMESLKFRQLYLENLSNIQLIEKNKSAGIYDVKINPFYVLSDKYLFIFNIKLDKTYTSNLHMAQYYGLNSITLNQDYFKINFDKAVRDGYAIYYDLGNGLNEVDKSEAYVYNNFDGDSVYLEFPASAEKTLRFDPGYGINKKYVIKSIEISQNDKITLYDGKELYKVMRPLHSINKLYLNKEYLVIEVLGDDPQIEIDLNKKL